jgi:hypothetical protein
MSELRPVRPRTSIVDRNLDFVVRVVVIGIVVAVLKPWTWFPGASTAEPTIGPGPAASPSGPAGPEATVHVVGFDDLAYDPAIFGTREPTAHWDLWPAAYLVTYGFVIQLGSPDQTAGPLPVESPPASPLASSAPTPRPTPAPTPTPPADGGPSWPDSVTVPAGYHMFLIGIDMPTGYQLSFARLLRASGGAGGATEIALSHPPAPWPDHFAVLGIPAVANADHLSVWAPATYRLELQFDFTGTGAALGNGHVVRAIEITVEALPGAVSSPLPS